MTALYKTSQIRALESLAYSEGLDTEIGLMNKAGEGAFKALLDHWPSAKSVVVVCGKGNNGGDGFVLAKFAKTSGISTKVLILCDISDYKGPAKAAAEACLAAGVAIQAYEDQLDESADVIVDALLGIGIQGEVSDRYAAVIEQINASKKPVLSIDTPSGIDVETGSVMGVAVKADLTISFIAIKQGLLTNKAPAHCGKLLCDNLQLPERLFSTITPTSMQMDWEHLRLALPKREKDAHKGRYGHVLIIGGDYGMGGAIRMAAEGALRVGSGLVSVATRPEHVSMVGTCRPEIMTHQVASAKDLEPLLENATVVGIGPGLGKTEWAEMLLDTVLAYDHPKLLDADALNLLSKKQRTSNQWILTPHPGEASRLLDIPVKTVQADRFASAQALQEKYGGVIVLKGAGTLVKAANQLPQICTAGNPGMASGGMGDVLSGVITGFLAQHLSPTIAAELGVLVHAIAADRAAEAGGERGLLATDLMKYLRQLVNPEEAPS